LRVGVDDHSEEHLGADGYDLKPSMGVLLILEGRGAAKTIKMAA